MSQGVVILKRQDPEDRFSPEFQELLRSTCREAKKAFGEVRLVVARDSGSPSATVAGTEPFVLLLDRRHALLRRATLEAMRNRVTAGCVAVAPLELSALQQGEELYSVGAFERVEENVLAAGEPADAADAKPCDTVLLLDRTAISQSELEAWGGGSEPLPDLVTRLDLEGSVAGVAHTFIDYYGEVRSDVLDFVPPETRTVLEVGCGRGLTGALLRRERGLTVTGFELNPEVAADARTRLDDVVTGDVLTVEPPSRYDLILALELFEHLTDGHRFLERALEWLEPQGRLVLSVPNVGHWSVVEELLHGRFDYLPIGLLCTTHFRFFTRRTLEDWIGAAGIDDYEIVPQKTPLPDRFDALTDTLGADRDSLATKGFWVSIGR